MSGENRAAVGAVEAVYGEEISVGVSASKGEGSGVSGEVSMASGDRGDDVAVQVADGGEAVAGAGDGSGVLCGEVESAGNEHSAVWAGGFGGPSMVWKAFLECFRSRIEPILCSDLAFAPGGADQRKKLLFPAPTRLTLFTGASNLAIRSTDQVDTS